MAVRFVKYVLSLAMVFMVFTACSSKDMVDENSDPMDSGVILDSEPKIEESENSSINSSNQNTDSSTLVEEFESDMKEGVDDFINSDGSNADTNVSDESSIVDGESVN